MFDDCYAMVHQMTCRVSISWLAGLLTLNGSGLETMNRCSSLPMIQDVTFTPYQWAEVYQYLEST